MGTNVKREEDVVAAVTQAKKIETVLQKDAEESKNCTAENLNKQNYKTTRVTYNAASDELLRNQTLVKGAIVLVDAAPFKLYQHYGVEFAARKFSVAEKGTYTAEAAIKKMNIKEPACREPPTAKELQKIIQEQFDARQWLARITSRPGQCGRADGYILEGKELLFYMKKMNYKKLPGRSCYDFMNIKIMFE